MSHSNPSDRRKNQRAVVTTQVSINFPNVGGFVEAFSSNVSETGIFIQTEEAHPMGTEVQLSLKLMNGSALIQGRGKVVRVVPKGAKDDLPGMGIKFIDLDETSRKIIKSVVELNTSVTGKTVKFSEDPYAEPDSFVEQRSLADDMLSVMAKASAANQVEPDAKPDDETPDFDNELPEESVAEDQEADLPPLPETPEQVAAPAAPTAQPVAKPADDKKRDAKGKGIVVGIDLGTTFSCVAFVQDGVPKVIPSSRGYTTTPSMVALTNKGKIVVGQVAYDQIITNPQNTIYGSKRLIGRPYNSPIVQQMKRYFTYDVVEGKDHLCSVKIGDKMLGLPEISAYILAELRDVAQGTLDTFIRDAVISVPAFYNDNQRQAVKKAGELAGFNVLRIVNEPTAAALAYGFNRKLKEKIMVFDLGGGTFDVSVLELEGNAFRVYATGGDTFLGGADFDRRCMFEIIRRFKEQNGIDLTQDKVALQRIKNAAEKAKKDLSFQDEVSVALPYIASKQGKPVDLDITLTRSELEQLTIDLVRRTLDITGRVLASKKMTVKDVDEVLLVGGQTRMPIVRRMVEEYFGKEPRKGVHPEEVVALGAALLGNSLRKDSLVHLQDVLSMPIGIALPGGSFKTIIDKNTPLPFKKDYKISNLATKTGKLEIDIYQGESEKIIGNEYLGTFTFEQLNDSKQDKISLAMTFNLNEECILTIVATDINSGRQFKSTMVTKDTPDSLREAVRAEVKEKTEASKSDWLSDMAKRTEK